MSKCEGCEIISKWQEGKIEDWEFKRLYILHKARKLCEDCFDLVDDSLNEMGGELALEEQKEGGE